MNKAICRIIDANLNRVREGLRVCEDIFRFVKNNPRITSELKQARHDLNHIRVANNSQLLFARESLRDVGKKSYVHNGNRATYESVLIANFKRAEEGLRVLEECSKILNPKSFPRFQDLRFKVYELEKRALKKV